MTTRGRTTKVFTEKIEAGKKPRCSRRSNCGGTNFYPSGRRTGRHYDEDSGMISILQFTSVSQRDFFRKQKLSQFGIADSRMLQRQNLMM